MSEESDLINQIHREWKDILKDVINTSDSTNKLVIKWAEKFGKSSESIANSLRNIENKLDIPFYKNYQFWIPVFNIIFLLILCLIVIKFDTCVKVGALDLQLGSCQ